MNLYPKWLLALAGSNLLAVPLSVFHLFGRTHVFGHSENGMLNFLSYLGTQCIWIVPILLFFAALRAHDNQHPVWAAIISIAGLSMLVADACYLFA